MNIATIQQWYNVQYQRKWLASWYWGVYLSCANAGLKANDNQPASSVHSFIFGRLIYYWI